MSAPPMRTLTLWAVLVSTASFGGTLHNSDAQEYRLHLKTVKGETLVSLNASTALERTCSVFPCTLRNEDSEDTVELTCAEQNVDIKDGKFSVSEGGGGGGGESHPAPAPVAKPSRGKRH